MLHYQASHFARVDNGAWVFPTMDKPRVLLSEVIADASRRYGVTAEQIKGKSRTKRIARARQFVCYHGLRLPHMSSVDLGQRLGGRDHSTVLYGAYAHATRHGLQTLHTTCWRGKNKVSYEGPEPLA